MSLDNLSLGFGGVSRFSGARGRTADGTNRSGIRYPSPFFDIGQTYLPPSMKSLMRWCRYYYLLNPLINTVIHKMSEYPITEIVIDERDPSIKEKWEELLGTHLRYRAFQIEVGLDYHTYGMCVVTIHFPFTKWLICRNCKTKVKAKDVKYRWRQLDYILPCKCGHEGPAIVQDYYERDVRRIRLVRWNPEHIFVDPGFPGSDPAYTFELPQQLRNDLIIGRKTVIDNIPDVFVEAQRRNKTIRFSPENVFVFKRPIISQKDHGWGMPLILPVLKDSFYLQVLRKAQEAIAQEHIVPLRVLFPQAGSSTSDPYTTIDIANWKDRIESEIAKWKYDCISPDSLVEGFDPNGSHQESLLRAEDVKEGFFLRNHLGSVSRVAKVWRRPMRDGEKAFKLHVRGLSAVESVVSEGHPFYAARKLNNGHGHKLGLPEFVRVKDLRAGDYIGYPVLKRKGTKGPYAHDTEMAWVMGLYLAEGNVTAKQVLFSLHKTEVDYQDRLRKFFLERFNAKGFVSEKSENGIQLVFSSVEAAKVFTELCHGVSATKRIHSMYMQGEDDIVLPLLQGLLDGDGCGHEDGYSDKLTYGTVSRQLVEDARQLFFSLGIPASLSSSPEHTYRIETRYGVKTGNAKEAYCLSLFADSKRRFLEMLEGKEAEPVRDLRIGVFKDGYFWHRIKSIEEVEQEGVIGFETEKNDSIVRLSDDTEAHGTFCLWGMACANSNYIPILPLPIGNQTIGGDSKALGLYQEMQVWSEQIVAGMGVPKEFIFGGMQYSGSNVSMRMLENMFIGYRTDHEAMLNQFTIRRISHFMGWPAVRAHMRRFKMADDLQRTAFFFQLNQAQKISDQTLLQEADQDPVVEKERKQAELSQQLDYQRKIQTAQASIQGEVMLSQTKYQVEAQKMQMAAMPQPQPGMEGQQPQPGMEGQPSQEQSQPSQAQPGQPQQPQVGQQGEMLQGQEAMPGMPEGSTISMQNAEQPQTEGVPPEVQSPITSGMQGGGENLIYFARRAARALEKMPEAQKYQELEKMKMTNPQLYSVVFRVLQSRQGSQADPLDAVQSPLPEQKPTRRVAPVG